MWANSVPRETRENPSGLSRRAMFVSGKEGVEVDPHEWARRAVNQDEETKGVGNG